MVAAARNGDREARNALLVAHVGIAFVEASKRRDKDEARSEALLCMVGAVDEFLASDLPAEKVSAYLKVAAARAAVDADRDELRHQSRLRRKYGGLNEEVDRRKPRVERGALTDAEAREAILEMACAWPEADVLRHKMEGLSNKEAARRIGISEARVTRVIQDLAQRWARRIACEDLHI